jgi:hypothetical protein
MSEGLRAPRAGIFFRCFRVFGCYHFELRIRFPLWRLGFSYPEAHAGSLLHGSDAFVERGSHSLISRGVLSYAGST